MRAKGEISVEDVLVSRMIADPIHLLECCIVNQGGGAVVVTTAERARDLGRPSVRILGWGEGHGYLDPNSAPGLTAFAGALAADTAFGQAGVSRDAIDVVGMSDHFTINGLAVAGGLELALCCDIRVASEESWFGLFEVGRGIMAGVAVNLLPRLMPFGAVMDLMLTGDRLPAADAYRLGLVQQLAPAGTVLEAAVAKAEKIAKQSQPAVWGTKKVLRMWRDAMLAEQQRYYEAVVHRVFLSGDMHEGPRAFVEKREPCFGNKWPDPMKGK